jgi:hypothetical protein
MPVKELPPELVARLRKAVENAERHNHSPYRALSNLMSIDSRPPHQGHSSFSTSEPGLRVRKLGVDRNFPGVEVAIKRLHDYPPEIAISILTNAVRRHNMSHSPEDYELIEPKAYPLKDDLVAMSKEDCISMSRLVSGPDVDLERQRWLGRLSSSGFGLARLQRISSLLMSNVVLEGVKEERHRLLQPTNMLVLGVGDSGKLRIVPAFDIF